MGLAFPLMLWSATYDVTVDLINYTCDTSTSEATLVDGKMTTGDVNLPSVITYNGADYKVTTIESKAFENNKEIKTIFIPPTISMIGNGAFFGTQLNQVNISDLVAWCAIEFQSYDANPLYSGSNLYIDGDSAVDLYIPDGVTKIGNYAFYSSLNIESVTVSESVLSIGERAFQQSRLQSANIGNGVEEIGEYAFYGSSLTSVTIGKNLKTVGKTAFANPSSYSLKSVIISDLAAWCNIDFADSGSNPLSQAFHLYMDNEEVIDLVIPGGVTEVKQYVFNNCTSFASIKIPDSVISIGQYAFSSCTNVSSLKIGNSVKTIGERAFISNNILELDFPVSVEYIGMLSFSDCTALKSIRFLNPNTQLDNSVFSGCTSLETAELPENLETLPYTAFENCRALTSINLPSNLKYIDSSAFRNCNLLEAVNFPEGLETIGENAFSYCNLREANLPSSLLTLERGAFSNCKSLEEIAIPENLKTIGSGAFEGCTNLIEVTLGSNIPALSDRIFNECINLKGVNLKDLAAWCSHDFGEVNNWLSYFYWVGTSIYADINLYVDGELLTNLVVPEGVTTIGNAAFYGYKPLTNITFPETVTSIGNFSFHGCINLQNIAFPGSVKTINEYAFSECAALKEVSFGNGLVEIGRYAFYKCSSLTNLDFPNSLESIEDGCFYQCYNLNQVNISDGVTNIGSAAFSECYSLERIKMGKSIKKIGNNAFNECTGLNFVEISDIAAWCAIYFNSDNSNPIYYGHHIAVDGEEIFELEIPEGVTSISSNAFNGASNLVSVKLPESLTQLGTSTFAGCTDVLDYYVYNPVPPSLYASTFSDYSATLHVPFGTIETYSSRSYWKEFTNIEEMVSSGINEITANEAEEIKSIYSIDGKRLGIADKENLPAGVYIINGKKVYIR